MDLYPSCLSFCISPATKSLSLLETSVWVKATQLNVKLMNEISTKWVWNDGWILMAIHMTQTENGASLSSIISAADATNHAIPTAKELTRAFTKFIQHSLVEISKNHYFICDQYRDSISQAYSSKGGLFETANKGLKWLKNSILVKDNESLIVITESDVEKAYKEYTSKLKIRK